MLLDEKIKIEAKAGRKHYVYVAKHGSKVVYVGKGSGVRYKHAIDGKSSNLGVNRYYFKAELLGEKPLKVDIHSFFKEEQDAFDTENKMIEELKPECNISLLPYHEQLPIIYKDKHIIDIYNDRTLIERLLGNIDIWVGYKIYDTKNYIEPVELEKALRNLGNRALKKNIDNMIALVPDTYIDIIKPRRFCRSTGDVKTMQRYDRDLKVPTNVKVDILSYPLAPTTRVLNFKKYLNSYTPKERILLSLLESMVMCGALEHQLIFHTVDRDIKAILHNFIYKVKHAK
jgi:hypothetical protein